VRLGDYGPGVVKGETLLTSKVGQRVVHARHRQGGSSSHRFERHREKQMETFFTRVCGHVREQLEPFARQLDYIIYGGTRETILDFRKTMSFFAPIRRENIGPVTGYKRTQPGGAARGDKGGVVEQGDPVG